MPWNLASSRVGVDKNCYSHGAAVANGGQLSLDGTLTRPTAFGLTTNSWAMASRTFKRSVGFFLAKTKCYERAGAHDVR